MLKSYLPALIFILLGFLWGGLVRHFVTQQATFAVNSVAHVWGSRGSIATASRREPAVA